MANGEVLDAVVDELARVIWDGHDAKLLVRRAGLPSQHVPEFKSSLSFWARAVQAAADGMVEGGAQAVVRVAASQFPGNEIFSAYLAQAAIASGGKPGPSQPVAPVSAVAVVPPPVPPTGGPLTSTVYLGHCKADAEVAERLATTLRDGHGVGVWLADWEIGPGDIVVRRLEEGMAQADVFLVLMSEPGLGDGWMSQQYVAMLAEAIDRPGVLAIPVLVGGLAVARLPGFLRTRQAVALGDVSRIAWAIERHRGRTTPQPSTAESPTPAGMPTTAPEASAPLHAGSRPDAPAVPSQAHEELGEDAQDLLERIVAPDGRPVVFLLGSALTMRPSSGGSGVPDVRRMVAMLREELGGRGGTKFDGACERAEKSGSGQDHGDAYREGFAALARRRGQDAVNRVIRAAVLEAHERLDDGRRAEVLAGHPDEHREPCQRLLDDLRGWRPLRPSVAALGEVLTIAPKRFPRVLTTNFDPLIEIAVRRAGGTVRSTILARDGNPAQNRGQGTHVLYVHGYWFDADTLHTEVQLSKPRAQLEASLRRLIDRSLLVVLGYGGWDDVLMKSLRDVAMDDGAYPEIAWGFHRERDPSVVTKLDAAGERVQIYEHVDLHRLLPRVRDRLRGIDEPPRSAPHRGSQSNSAEERASSRAGAAAGEDDPRAGATPPWNGIPVMTRILENGPVVFVAALGRALNVPDGDAGSRAEQVAKAIEALGGGPRVTLRLLDACLDAWNEVKAEHAGELREASAVALRLSSEWLPRRYGDGTQVKPADHGGDPKLDGYCPDIEVATNSPAMRDLHVATADGTALKVEMWPGDAKDGQQAWKVHAPRSLPDASAVLAEMKPHQDVAVAIVKGLTDQFSNLLGEAGEPTLEERVMFACSRLIVLRKTGDPRYLVVDTKKTSPEVLRELKKMFPPLRFVSSTGAIDRQEGMVLAILAQFFIGRDEGTGSKA